MTKQNLVDYLTHDCGLHRSSAIRAVEGVITAISDSLAKGENVYLRGFATFQVVERAEKLARNITTGEPVVVPAHKAVSLKLSSELKNKINS